MGLPLYRAPVETDIKSKVPKDPPTRSRSTIRRLSQDRYPTTRRSDFARRRAIVRASARVPTETQDDSRTGLDNAVYDISQRNGMSQEMARYFGEHMARLHAATSSNSSSSALGWPENSSSAINHRYSDQDAWVGDFDGPPPELPPLIPPPDHDRFQEIERNAETLLNESDALLASIRHNHRAPTPPARPTPRYSRPFWQSESRPSLRSRTRAEMGRMAEEQRLRGLQRELALLGAGSVRPSLTRESTVHPQQQRQQQQQESPVDGLGDRNRSMSPENDDVWDTLLSSITPDPQPPSVGTSFASTSAPVSASTSQTTVASAAAAPATADGLYGALDTEHPCESGGDNSSDTENEDDWVGRLRGGMGGASYAEVVGGSPRSQRQTPRSAAQDEDLDVLRGVSGMQRIVRNLARREDIPDEWWAEVGLSRSLPREAA